MLRILIVTAVTFLIPSCILGMISPVVVKLVIHNLERVGNIVGKIYAISTLGSIAGTFAAGFFPYLLDGYAAHHTGNRLRFDSHSGSLGFTVQGKKTCHRISSPSLPSHMGTYDLAFKPPLTADTYYYNESDYYTLKLKRAVSRDGKTKLEALILDNLVHSYVDLGNPLHIEYQYEKIYAEVLKWRFKRDAAFSALTIGGGGCTPFRDIWRLFIP